jgi:hypothetical protein
MPVEKVHQQQCQQQKENNQRQGRKEQQDSRDANGGFIKGILRGVRCTKSLRVLFLHRRPPSWTTLVLYSRAVFIFNEPASTVARAWQQQGRQQGQKQHKDQGYLQQQGASNSGHVLVSEVKPETTMTPATSVTPAIAVTSSTTVTSTTTMMPAIAVMPRRSRDVSSS